MGDWSNEQLRLRGFYKDDRTEEKLEKISRLQDYLLEYCSYGCAYFVLENEAPKRASFDKKMRKKEEETPSKKERNRLKQNENRMQIRKIDVVRKTSILRKRTRDNVILSFVRSE